MIENLKFENLKSAKRQLDRKDFLRIHRRALAACVELQNKELELIKALQAVDKNKVHRYLGFNSCFQYAVKGLGLTESQACAYICVARKAAETPALQESLEEGSLTIAKARRVTSVINQENAKEWVKKAKTLTKRELEKLVVQQNPGKAVPDHFRQFSASHLHMQCTIKEEVYKKLQLVQELVSQKSKSWSHMSEVLEKLCDTYIEKHDPMEKAKRAVLRKQTAQKRATGSEHLEQNKEARIGLTDQRISEDFLKLKHKRSTKAHLGLRNQRITGALLGLDDKTINEGSLELEHESINEGLLELEHESINQDLLEMEHKPINGATVSWDHKSITETLLDIDRKPSQVAHLVEDRKKVTKDLHGPGQKRLRQFFRRRVAIPARVVHQVNLRDEGKCQYKDESGQVCHERKFVELHHVKALSQGGEHTLANLLSLCSGHHKVVHGK